MRAVASSLNRKQLQHAPAQYITHLLVPRHGTVYSPAVDDAALAEMGIRVVEVASLDPEGDGQCRFDAEALTQVIAELSRTPAPLPPQEPNTL